MFLCFHFVSTSVWWSANPSKKLRQVFVEDTEMFRYYRVVDEIERSN